MVAYIRRNLPKPGTPEHKVVGVLNKTCGVGDVLALRGLIRNLAGKYPDHAVDVILPERLHPYIKDHPLVRRTLGPNLLKQEQFSTLLDLSDLTLKNPDRHPIAVWSQYIGITSEGWDPEISLQPLDLDRASRYLRKLSSTYLPLILLCPFSALPQKSLKPETAQEIHNLLQKSGYCPLVVHWEILQNFRGNQTGKLPFKTWAALFHICDGVITVATSHLWLASFYNKPTLGLLGSEGCSKYRALSSRLIEYRPSCPDPCYKPLDCKVQNRCLDVDPEEVLRQIKAFGLAPETQPVADHLFTTDRPPQILDFSQNNLVGVRIQGLLGDSIKAASVISSLPEDRKVLISLAYPDIRRHPLVQNLFSHLLRSGRIVDILPSPRPGLGTIQPEEIQDLRSRGCREIYDITVLSSEFGSYPQTKPDLGLPAREPIKGRVCLMRRSHFHDHFSLRNRPYQEWDRIEGYLVKAGFQPEILGLDDPMPNPHGLPDYRRLLTPLQTLERVMGSELVISLPTFVPVYSCQYRPTIVLSDPRDIPQLRDRWYAGGDVTLFDVTQPYIEPLLELIKTRFQGGGQ